MTDLWVQHTAEFSKEVLPKPPGRILEVGCGRGEVARRLADLGYDVTPIDIDRQAVGAAKRLGLPARRADFLMYRGDRTT